MAYGKWSAMVLAVALATATAARPPGRGDEAAALGSSGGPGRPGRSAPLSRAPTARGARADKGGWEEQSDGSWVNTETGEVWGGGDKDDSAGKDQSGDKDTAGTDGGKDEWGEKPNGAGGSSVYPRSCITHDGVERCWLTYAPSSAAASAPLIVYLHGGGGSAADSAAGASEWVAIAEAEGAVVVWADGIDGMWNSEGSTATAASKFDQDDVGFLRGAIAAILVAHPTVDSSRIYMTGYSLGCFMSHGLAVEASDLVAAVACAAGTLAIPEAPADYEPTAVMHIHGNQDEVIPYSTATVEDFAAFNGCASPPVVSSHTGYNRHQYGGCDPNSNGENVEVTLIELLGVRHDVQTEVPYQQMSWDFISRFKVAAGDSNSNSNPEPSSCAQNRYRGKRLVAAAIIACAANAGGLL